MSVLFTNEECLSRVDALVIAEGTEPPVGEYIITTPIKFDAVDRFLIVKEVTAFFTHALVEAVQRGYTAVAVRFPELKSRILYANFLKINLMRIVAPFDIDVYIIVGEGQKRILRDLANIDDIIYPVMYRSASASVSRPIPKNARRSDDYCCSMAPEESFNAAPVPSLADFIRDMDDTFAVRLLKLIDIKGMDEVKCYKAANVSRQTWYKIMNEGDYRPSKVTVISFAISLELDLDETQTLLATAGYTLSGSILFDKIISYCIKEGIFDIFEINKILYSYDQECLGA